MSDSLVLERTPRYISAEPGRKVTITNAGAGDVYYKKTSDVDPLSKDGTIAAGASETFHAPQWLVSTATAARLFLRYTPDATTDMATQAELDALALVDSISKAEVEGLIAAADLGVTEAEVLAIVEGLQLGLSEAQVKVLAEAVVAEKAAGALSEAKIKELIAAAVPEIEFGTEAGQAAEGNDPRFGESGSGKANTNDKILYVSTSGNDSNDGLSYASAFKTIQKAIEATTGKGYVIQIGGGTFTENLSSFTENLRLVGILATPENRGTEIRPVADDSVVADVQDVDGVRFEHITFRNESRASWRGVFLRGLNVNAMRAHNCSFYNQTATCSNKEGVLGGTGIFLSRGENNRFSECRFGGLHLDAHLGRENAQSVFIGCQSAGSFHGWVADNALYYLDEMASYSSYGYLVGSSSILAISSNELAAKEAGTAQTIKYAQLLGELQSNSRWSGKVTIGEGKGFGFTARNLVLTTTTEGTQNPANGEKLKVKSVANIPTKGVAWIKTGTEAVTYTGVHEGNKELEGITRGAMGTSNTGSITSGSSAKIATLDCLIGRYNKEANKLEIAKQEAGTITALASTSVEIAKSQVRYLDFEVDDNALALKIYTADPWNPGDPFWPAGTAAATVTYTLEGANATKFGKGIEGFNGHRLDTTDATWRVDNARLWTFCGAPAGGGAVKRWKATSNPSLKRRDGTTINESTAPTHRSEYYAYSSPETITTNAVYEQVDWAEGAYAYLYWGDSRSVFVRCLGADHAEFAGDHNDIRGTAAGKLVVTGENNHVRTHINTSITDSGERNKFWLGQMAGNSGLPEVDPISTELVTFNSTTEIPATIQRLPTAQRRTGVHYGHSAAQGCVAATPTLTYSVGVKNGYLTPIFVGGQATWSSIRFEVSTGQADASERNCQLAVYALDPFTLLPASRLLDASTVGIKTAGEKSVAISLKTSCTWLGVLLYVRVGANAVFRGIESGAGTMPPFGFGETINAGPGIFPRYSVPDGGAPASSSLVLADYATSGPIVRLLRSA